LKEGQEVFANGLEQVAIGELKKNQNEVSKREDTNLLKK
jgi:hypothetical protein